MATKAKKTAKKTKKISKVAKKAPEKTTLDWSDGNSVRDVMAQALEVPVEDLEISDASESSFGTGTFYQVTHGRVEYTVAENDDAAHELAIAVVTQDLESEPEIFEKHFIENHIDTDRLRRDLSGDVESNNYDNLKEEADRRPMAFYKDNGLDIPEPSEEKLRAHAEAMSDEENSASSIYDKLKDMGDAEDRWIELGEDPDVRDQDIVDLADAQALEQLKDPVAYLTDIYGQEDGVKKAIEIGGIDVKAAAEEAVSTDGEGHFLARYDGHMHEGPNWIVYWRTN